MGSTSLRVPDRDPARRIVRPNDAFFHGRAAHGRMVAAVIVDVEKGMRQDAVRKGEAVLAAWAEKVGR